MRQGDDAVREQYELYPYPARDPKDEAKRLITGSPSNVLEIDHYLFRGERDWSQPFRALVAGGGTGDGLIMLAQQLADLGSPAEIHYLDLARASRQIAERRAAVRGLRNVTFHTGSLLDAPAIGPFDYIDCCGVLHHLPDPVAGMTALCRALAPGGGMGVMVYGTLGREGVYPLQDLLRRMGEGLGAPERLALARRLVKALPPTNALARNPFLVDHLGSDAGVYDLLLHSQDRSYRVGEVLELLAASGTRLVSFIEPARYRPETYIADPVLRRSFAAMETAAAAAAAEILAGMMKSHTVYAVGADRADDTVAIADGPDVVPVLRGVDGPTLARGLDPGRVKADLGGASVLFPLPRLAGAILQRIDGRATLDEIRRQLPAVPDWLVFKAEFDALHAVFGGLNTLLLRRPLARQRDHEQEGGN